MRLKHEGKGKEFVHSDSFQQLQGNQFPQCWEKTAMEGAGRHKARVNMATGILELQV